MTNADDQDAPCGFGAPLPPEPAPVSPLALEKREQALHAFKQANRAAKRGDHGAAVKWSALAEKMAMLADKSAALPAPVEDAIEVERLRAELRAPILRYVDAAQRPGVTDEELEAIARGEDKAGAQV